MSNSLGGRIVSNFQKTIRIIRWIIKKPEINLYHIINYSPRVPFTLILVTGAIKLNTTLLEERLDRLTRDQVAYLLEHILLKDLSRYEDR